MVYTVLKDIFIFQVCFSDESMFAISEESSQYIRRSADEEFSPQCVAQTVKHPTQVMVWSVMSAQGTGRLYIVEGMMNQHQYKKVLENRLLPQLKDWFPNNDFVFMHDGAPVSYTHLDVYKRQYHDRAGLLVCVDH